MSCLVDRVGYFHLIVAVKSQLQIEVAYTPLNRGGSVEAPR